MAAVTALRDGFAAQGITCHGTPSPLVLMPFTDDRLARLTARRVADGGVFVDLVEYPAVPVEQARLRLQAMATHEVAQAQEAVQRIIEAQRLAEQDLKLWRPPGQRQ
jgi:7-keto-8-aminopelargonate synthetase-like enzyme